MPELTLEKCLNSNLIYGTRIGSGQLLKKEKLFAKHNKLKASIFFYRIVITCRANEFRISLLLQKNIDKFGPGNLIFVLNCPFVVGITRSSALFEQRAIPGLVRIKSPTNS